MMLQKVKSIFTYLFILTISLTPFAAKAEFVTWELDLVNGGASSWWSSGCVGGCPTTPWGIYNGSLKKVRITYDRSLPIHNYTPTRKYMFLNKAAGTGNQISTKIGDYDIVADQVFRAGVERSLLFYGASNDGKSVFYDTPRHDFYITHFGFSVLLSGGAVEGTPLPSQMPPNPRGTVTLSLSGRTVNGGSWGGYYKASIIGGRNITTANAAPIAEAGPDQSVTYIGETVILDGTQSHHPDGEAFSYFWEFAQKPAGSTATLDDPTSATPSFTADVHDVDGYVLKLTVTDANGLSASDTVNVSFTNLPPVAVADVIGADIRLVGDEVCFDGSASNDPNLDQLTYSWSIISQPTDSTTEMYNQTSIVSCFLIDQDGVYDISLVVNDGFVDSAPGTVIIKTASYQVGELLTDALTEIDSMSNSAFSRNNNGQSGANKKREFGEKVEEVRTLLEQQLYQDAYDLLVDDVIGKTDGCATDNAADNNDWIRICDDPDDPDVVGQNQLYPILIEARDILQLLL